MMFPAERRPYKNVFYIGKPTEPSVPAPSLKETTAPRYERETKGFKQDMQRERQATTVALTKPKTVLLPGSPPEIAYAPPQPPSQQRYYDARAGVPFTRAIGTETKKTVRMDESTENARRVVTVEQTSRVIKFGDTGHAADVKVAQKAPKASHYRVPTPRKFVQGQFRESDYESDVDLGRIRAKWAPADSDTEEPCYRKVQPPTLRSPRSSSAPVRQMHVASPMEFDAGPLTMSQTRRIERGEEVIDKRIDQQQHRYQQRAATRKTDGGVLQPGSPPEYGFATRSDVKKAADRKSQINVT